MNNVISFFRPGPMPRHALPRGATLTQSMKRRAAEIIARFSPAEDSLQSRREMKAALTDAGLKPGHDLRQVLRQAGFQTVHATQLEEHVPHGDTIAPREIKDLGPPRRLPAFIQRFLDRWRSGDASPGETDTFVAEVRTMRAPPRGIFVNLLA